MSELPFAILIPTRNRAELLRETLSRLTATGFRGCPLWVYDDASADAQAVQTAVADWPDARLVRGEERVGQAAGRNRLLEACGREFAIMLDDDQYVVNKGPLFDYMDWPADVRPPAVVAFQSVNVGDGRCAIRGRLPVGAAFTFMGGACLFHVPSVLAAGGYREFFVYGWEEPELAMRLWLRGHALRFDTRIVVEHNHRLSPDAARDPAEYDFLYARNILLTHTLNAPLWLGCAMGLGRAARFVLARGRHPAAAARGLCAGLVETVRRWPARTPASSARVFAWLRYVRRCRRQHPPAEPRRSPA